MSKENQYDADYFLRGKETGKSLYENYRWMPELTIPMAQTIVDYCGIEKGSRILDFGCARGYLVKALRGLGYDAYGHDISKWAIENCDGEVKRYVGHEALRNSYCEIEKFDWIIAKDVLEHVSYVHLTINDFMASAQKGIFVVVPLSKFNQGRYVVEEYEKDVTHTQRWPLGTWVNMFLEVGWKVEASYRIPGIKDNYAKYERGNGFIVARRIN